MRGSAALVTAVVLATISVASATSPDGLKRHLLRFAFQRADGSSIFEEVDFTPRTIFAVLLTFTVSALANAGGLGGGGFLVPLFNLILGVSLKRAMGLSQASITGGAIAAGALAIFSSHPDDSSQPLLDMNIALLFLPCLLIGVTLGVTLNEIFPDWVLVIILSVLLVVLSVRSLKTGIRLHRAEVAAREGQNSAIEAQSLLPASSSSEIPHLLGSLSQPSQIKRTAISMDLDSHAETTSLQQSGPYGSLPTSIFASNPLMISQLAGPADLEPCFKPILSGQQIATAEQPIVGTRALAPIASVEDLEKESQKEPEAAISPFTDKAQHEEVRRRSWREVWQQVGKLGVGLLVWGGFLALQILKSQYTKCAPQYLMMYALQIFFGLSCSVFFMSLWWWSQRQRESRADLEQALIQAEGNEADSRMSLQKMITSAVCIVLGAGLSALCGLGGGMILGPVMLELGLHPMVVASTSLLLVGASSSTATVQFALGDRLEYGWGIIMFGVCVVASLVGVAGFGRVVRSSGRASLIVFLLFFLMAAGGIMTLVFGVVDSIDSLEHGGRIGFLNLCDLLYVLFLHALSFASLLGGGGSSVRVQTWIF